MFLFSEVEGSSPMYTKNSLRIIEYNFEHKTLVLIQNNDKSAAPKHAEYLH